RELHDAVEEFGADNPDTRLKIESKGKNPDDAISAIPYEKGFAFIQVIEKEVGRERLDDFLRKYFDAFAFKSVTTPEFEAFLKDHLVKNDKDLLKRIKYDAWVHASGIPDNMVPSISPDFNRIDSLQKAWRKTGVAGLSSQIRTTNERRHFIDHLPNDLTIDEM